MIGRLMNFRVELEHAAGFLSRKDSVDKFAKYFPNIAELSNDLEKIEGQSILIDCLTDFERNDVGQMNRGRVEELAEKCSMSHNQIVEFLLQFMVVQHSPSENEAVSFFEALERFRTKIGTSPRKDEKDQ